MSRPFKNVPGLELFQRAGEAIDKKDLPLGLQYFDEIIFRTKGQSPLPLLSRATCHTELKQFNECVKDCEAILKLPSIPIQDDLVKGSTTSHSAAYSRLNNAYKELNMLEKAGEALQKRADLESEARKKAHEANKKIETEGPKIQELEPDDDEEDKKFNQELAKKIKEFKVRGKELFTSRRFEEASKVYKLAIQLEEEDHILHSNLSGCYIQMKQFDDALYHANECIRINGQWAKGYYRQGCALMGKKEYKLAYECLNLASKIEPNDPLILKEMKEAKKLSPGILDLIMDHSQTIIDVIVIILCTLYLTGSLNNLAALL